MGDSSFRKVEDSPTRLPQAIAQVQILVIEIKRFVEETNCVQSLTTSQDAGARQMLRLTTFFWISAHCESVPRPCISFQKMLQHQDLTDDVAQMRKTRVCEAPL